MIGPGVPPAGRGGRVAVFVLVAVAVVLAGAAVWLWTSASSKSDEAARLTAAAERADREASRLGENGNLALADTDATAKVTDQLRSAIELTFSYDHADLDATAKAVDRYLTGEARCQYDAVFAQVKELAPAQQVVLRTVVREIALVRLGEDEAEALVFVDQTSGRAGAQPVGAGAQFEVEARLDGDIWLVTKLDFFDQPLVSGQPAPEC